jgi:hypothetical protein
MTNLAIHNVSASLNNFEPVHVPNSLTRVRNCRADSFFDIVFRRTNDFKYLVNVIFQFFLAVLVSPDKRAGSG